MMSLFDYLGRAAGTDLGKRVHDTATKLKAQQPAAKGAEPQKFHMDSFVGSEDTLKFTNKTASVRQVKSGVPQQQ